ncbi:MAG: histidine kinase, partial [Niastella sp.]|nr:histidine kinase [Niastella sp.]
MRYALFRLTWLLLLSLFYTAVHAQEYSYARYDVKDGLVGSVVYHGVEDKEGFLWFATETGVSRFDGTHFKNFTNEDGLPDNEILKLFVDSKGRVWMMPFRNTICYYWKGKIYNQGNDSLLSNLNISGRIVNMLEDKHGNIILVFPTGFCVINNNQKIREIITVNGETLFVGGSEINSAGHIMFYGCLRDQYGLMEIDLQARLIGISPMLTSYAATMSRQGTYISDRATIVKIKDSLIFTIAATKQRRAIAIPHTFTNLSMMGDTFCTFNTGNGAYYYDIQAGKITRQVLPGTVVNWVFRDSEGNTWLLTAGSGIYRIGSFEFSNYTFSENNKNSRSVFSIYKSKDLLYIGSEKSQLFTIDLARQKIHHKYVSIGPNNSRILSIVPMLPDHLFLGTDLGVAELNNPRVIREIRMSIKSLKASGDSLLASVEHALLLLSKEGKYKTLPLNTYNNARMRNARITCAYEQKNVYYSGTLNGLYYLDKAGQTIWLGEQYPQLRSRITDIEGAQDSTLWITTHGEGVVAYKNGKVIYSIRQKNGLTSNICRNIFVAGNNDIWVGTDKGLNRIRLQEGQYQVTTFTSADGLLSNIINAIHVDSSQVYIGTPEGLTTFDVNKIALNSYCRLRMTGLQATGKPWTFDTTGFVLPPANNPIRFDYIGISYRSAGDISYRYRMVGLDNNWQTTRETFLAYPALPSGDYELQLIATNKFGVESEMIRIPFLVEKRLWEKTWFRLLALLIIGAAIWIFVSSRIRKIRRQNDEKIQINDRMAELEQMALKAQMNPHFIFNSLNSVQQYVIDKDLRGANKFITEFSRLIRLTLDISSRAKISIYEEISYLSTYLELEKTKFEDKFSYSVV